MRELTAPEVNLHRAFLRPHELAGRAALHYLD
jgi:hypothetical protein